MNKHHVKGAFKDIKGRVKEEIGHATNDSETAAKGVGDRIMGKIQKGFGDLKDAVKQKVDHVLEHEPRRKAS